MRTSHPDMVQKAINGESPNVGEPGRASPYQTLGNMAFRLVVYMYILELTSINLSMMILENKDLGKGTYEK